MAHAAVSHQLGQFFVHAAEALIVTAVLDSHSHVMPQSLSASGAGSIRKRLLNSCSSSGVRVGPAIAASTLMPSPPQQDRRRRPRTRVAWPVVVKAGTSRFLARSVDISTHGAKVRIKARLKTGTMVHLEFVPPDGPSLYTDALVWRVDADGLAFLFSGAIQHRLIRTT